MHISLSTRQALRDIGIILAIGSGRSEKSPVSPAVQSHKIAEVLSRSDFVQDVLGYPMSIDDVQPRLRQWTHQLLEQSWGKRKRRR